MHIHTIRRVVLITLLTCATGCGLDLDNKNGCEASADCTGTNVCVDGRCAPACLDASMGGRIDACDQGSDGDNGSDEAGDAGSNEENTTGPTCGDGVRDPDEACDDGDNDGGEGECYACAAIQRCGDGRSDGTESCDDGDNDGGEGECLDCSATQLCGDAVSEGTEACDDGDNDGGNDECLECTAVQHCGDGLQQGTEACDDETNDGSEGECLGCLGLQTCGDGVAEGTEACDDGANDGSEGECFNCTLIQRCGDGRTEGTEFCDDGDNDGGEVECLDCTREQVCGDGTHEGTEVCDDGNSDSGDGCSSTCLSNEICGNGIVDVGEACDMGTDCSPECQLSAASVTTGGFHSCAIRHDASVKCWGRNDRGQLGLGDTSARGWAPGEMGALPVVDLGSSAQAIDAGHSHTCAVLDGGRVKCWGFNNSGHLGQGDGASRGDDQGEMGDNLPSIDLGADYDAEAVALGYGHSCALSSAGEIKCWGRNLEGQLGIGDAIHRGEIEGELGDNLAAIDLGAGVRATGLATGAFHTCALLEAGAVKCWGSNSWGQLGQGDTETRGDGLSEMGGLLPAIDLGSERLAVAVAAGSYHSCALLDDGAVKCWGSAENGQLGLDDVESRGDQAQEMGDSLPGVDLGGPAVAVSAGNRHTCALLATGTMKCWGLNDDGQLGLGDTLDRGDEAGEMPQLPAIELGSSRSASLLAAGRHHTCVLSTGGTALCWGLNSEGQLGVDHSSSRGDDPGEMGDSLEITKLGP